MKVMIAGMLSLLIIGCDTQPTTPKVQGDTQVGHALPALTLSDMNGAAVDLTSFISEKPLVINMWATWCPPCLKEMPWLDTLAATGEVTVVAIAFDRQQQVVRDYLAKQDLPHLHILWDQNGKQTREIFGNFPLPTTFVVNRSGTVRAKELGERQWHHPKMLAYIKKVTKN